jgi:hypothetical protein
MRAIMRLYRPRNGQSPPLEQQIMTVPRLATSGYPQLPGIIVICPMGSRRFPRRKSPETPSVWTGPWWVLRNIDDYRSTGSGRVLGAQKKAHLPQSPNHSAYGNRAANSQGAARASPDTGRGCLCDRRISRGARTPRQGPSELGTVRRRAGRDRVGAVVSPSDFDCIWLRRGEMERDFYRPENRSLAPVGQPIHVRASCADQRDGRGANSDRVRY